MSDYRDLLEKCEADVRSGQAHLAARRIGEVSLARLPRELRLPLANVCRRAQLISLGLKILAPAIHPESRLDRPATSAECAEYAVLLTRLGAIEEALSYLDRADERDVREVRLYKAFCRFNRWEYAAALPDLERYLAADLEPYQRLIGRVNLAACQVALRHFAEAEALLTENISLARDGSFARLQGNCHELRAQVHLLTGKAEKAKRDLDRAAKLLGSEKTFDELFVRKWRAVLESQESDSTEPLEKFKVEALSRNDSESLREADYFSLKIRMEEERFQHLLFGTPFEGYRARIVEDLGRAVTTRFYRYGSRGLTAPVLDVSSGVAIGCASLPAGSKLHQVFGALLKDFYRPVRLGGLFAELFPGEAFNAFSSPDRVYQLLYRARSWLVQADAPVTITAKHGLFKLHVHGDFSFRVPLERSPLDEESLRLTKLRQTFKWEFTADEACSRLALSRSAFKRLAARSLSEGKLERMGAARAIRYRFRA